MCNKVKTLIVEDDCDFAFLIGKEIMQDERLLYLGHAASRKDAIAMAVKLRPDIVLMDLNLSGSEFDGIFAARDIKIATEAKILLLTSFEQQDVMINASKRAFAAGFISKSDYHAIANTVYMTATSVTPQEVFIRELVLGELSPAERSVLASIVEGDCSAQSASSLKTIANQKTSIFKKLGLKSTNELVSVFSR